MSTHKFFTTLNQPLGVQIYTLPDGSGDPTTYSTLEGLPLGTASNASDGEAGVKVIVIANRAAAGNAITLHSQILAASNSFDIPAGSKGYSVSFLTGTGTFNGAAVPAGFNESDANVNAAVITVTTDSASTAYIRYNS